MRTKAKEKTYKTRYLNGYLRLIDEQGLFRGPRLCASMVKTAFDIKRSHNIEFVVTNSKPKGSLANWHILRKRSLGAWFISSATHSMELMFGSSRQLSDDFPNNKTLYVCAY